MGSTNLSMDKADNSKKFIEEVTAFLGVIQSSDVTEVAWEKGEFGFAVSRQPSRKTVQPAPPTNGKNQAQGLRLAVVSPVVGTFHFSSEVQLGAFVKANQLLGYVNAVNVKHQVECDKPGKLFEVHVEEGQTVEFGQPLFTLEVPHVS